MKDSIFSFDESDWEFFDPQYAMELKKTYPAIWDMGGGEKSDYVNSVLEEIVMNDGIAETPEQVEILELRESWIKRHQDDFSVRGIVAQIKWLAVSNIGESEMKKAINNEVAKMNMRLSSGLDRKSASPCWPGYIQVGMKKGKHGKMVPNCVEEVKGKSEMEIFFPETKSAKPRLRDPKGGLTSAGRAYFKRKEGANLKPGVKGAADTPEKMRRKGSFLTRFFTNPSGPMKDENGKPTRLALSAAAWGEPVPQDASDAARLAAKGRRMLERYERAKKASK